MTQSMFRATVNVRNRQGMDSHDLEVPTTLSVQDLAQLIAIALEWEDSALASRYTVTVESEGRQLAGQQSLADQGVWDGAHLVIEPIPESASSQHGEAPQACLVTDTKRRHGLACAKTQIGRSSAINPVHNQNLSLVDLKEEPRGKTVSRHHADVLFTDHGWWVVPQATENQTLLNDVVLEPMKIYQLRDGDRLQCGAVMLRFEIQSDYGG